ncbi:DNA-binding transcriptional regulator OxyR [Actinobacillus delphinicola]|uniref:DNA-binding transcriptional regulator OxyR n=1 Tax=Actinobacillus delphinicola TaxID=51161 RepID=A0A448TTZ3_9PAST|nr:DNA-binding transcriptional regulator OxyR [Actinobacillus delphinicola]VEJ09467.1 DNA-binding transcriptional regulator OxyR [Actinobacillus delphinicola]
MNVRDLEYLVALAEYKHFRRAADACKVSQPTLSGQIRKLEEELNTILLERTSRKVLFTQSGLLLVDQARAILREIKQFKDMASQQGKEMSGPLHLGVIPTLGPYLLPYIVSTIKEEFPKIELFLYEAKTPQLVELLENGKLDCAILPSKAELDVFMNVSMFSEPMKLAVPKSHPFAARKTVDMKELHGKEILMLDDGHCLRDNAVGYCFTVGAVENKHYQATSLETLHNMVASGLGITLIPELAVLADRCGKVVYVPCVNPTPSREIVMIYRPGSPLRKRYERVARAISEAVIPVIKQPETKKSC